MGVDKGKKQKVEENSATEQVDKELVLSVEKLQEVQDELEKINEEASEKVLEIEQKYSEKKKPIYDKRSEVINSIPDFWMTAFMSHPALSELLTEEDQKIFKYLSSLEVEESKDLKSGCSITFNFKPNPYFEDRKLTKTFTFLEDGTKLSATSIKWKEGVDIPNGVEKTKGKKRSHSEDSFFSWFNDKMHKDDIAEFHDDVAEIIKDDLWQNPLTYFSTEVDEEDFDADDGDDEETGSDSAEENDEDEDDEDGDE